MVIKVNGHERVMRTLGKKIRLVRTRKGWTQEELAKQLHISIPALSKIETSVTDLTLSRLQQIASVLGLTAPELLALNDQGQLQPQVQPDDMLSKRLEELEIEKADLQKKLIELYEAVRQADRGSKPSAAAGS